MLVLLLALGVAVWLGLMAGGDSSAAPRLKPATAQARTEGAAPASSALEPEASSISGIDAAATRGATIASAPQAPLATTTELTGPERVEQWLTSSTDVRMITQKILEGFGSLKPEDHALAATKLAELLSDEDFPQVRALLLDDRTSDEAKDILYHDAMNRPDAVKLPLLFALMQQRGHHNAEEAHQALAGALGGDLGGNMGAWQAKIAEELRRQQ